MKIDKRAVLGLGCVVLSLFLILIINSKNVGRGPVLKSLSKSVAYPGDEVILIGDHFGGEISKGSIYLNDQLLFDNFINSWDKDSISINLPDDFKSGMISVSNMFGSSRALLITSIVDVPRVKTTDEVPGYPFVEDVKVVKNNLIRAEGRNLGSLWGNNSIIIIYKDNITDEEYIEIDSSKIIFWGDDYVDFYLPYGLDEATLFIRNSKGYSNYYHIPDVLDSGISYRYEDPREFSIIQKVDIKDIIALKGSYIKLFVPCVLEEGRQKEIVLNSPTGRYSRKSNTFNITLEPKTSGDEFSYILESQFIGYTQRTTVNRSQIGRKYDKSSPDYNEGFLPTPEVVEDNSKLNGGAVWVVRNSNNFYNKSQLIMEWVKKYIKLDSNESDNSLTAYTNRKGSPEGIVNLSISMLRAVGIPARKVKGINSEDMGNYSWIEFYLPQGGWVPFDIIKSYSGEYTPGTIDSTKIAFSKGVKTIPYQKSLFNNEIYAIQNRLDYSEGNIESYKAIWHNIEVQ